jgi:hypothetical protein
MMKRMEDQFTDIAGEYGLFHIVVISNPFSFLITSPAGLDHRCNQNVVLLES